MLMRDDLGLLLLGAREAIYALDSSDISVKKAAVRTFQTSPVDVVAGQPLIFFLKHHPASVTSRIDS